MEKPKSTFFISKTDTHLVFFYEDNSAAAHVVRLSVPLEAIEKGGEITDYTLSLKYDAQAAIDNL